jgi:4-hydroxybenzoate polyprenyltransferase
MPKIFLTILLLMRINSPVGYLLVFFPTLFGLFLAYEDLNDLIYIPIFFIASVLARSAGCIINDLFDKDFDKKVKRTKTRPLARNKISNEWAFFVLFLLLSMSFLILLALSFTALIVGVIAFCMIILYPLMKRFTYFPQAFLGLTFNLGCLIAYAAIKDEITLTSFIMYLACGFWTFGYDTIYAFMDIKDDKKIGIKSSAIYFEKGQYKLWIILSYSCFIVFYVIANLLYDNQIGAMGAICAIPILLWQVKTLDVTNPTNCFRRFKSNIYVGGLLALAMLAGCMS